MNINQVLCKEDTQLLFLDMELKETKTIGFAKTLGDQIGENKDISESKWDNAELTLTVILVNQFFKLKVI